LMRLYILITLGALPLVQGQTPVRL
jgi:hypothetical protein